MDKRIGQIADFYGLEHQCMKCLEEMAELSVEILKYLEKDNNGYRKSFIAPMNLEQELADVIIMTEQLKYLMDTGFVELEIDRKLERQLKRMKEGQEVE